MPDRLRSSRPGTVPYLVLGNQGTSVLSCALAQKGNDRNQGALPEGMSGAKYQVPGIRQPHTRPFDAGLRSWRRRP